VQDVGRATNRRSRVTDAALVGVSVVVLALVIVLAPVTAPAQVITAVPGDTIASEMAAGRIVSISPDGAVREIASGLQSPRGVAVLVDGSILVAETGRNRIVGIGGRYPSGEPTEVASVLYPEGISVGPDGTVYVTLLERGEMGRIDLGTGEYTAIATGLEGPGDVAARGFAMFVTESAPDGRVVTQVAADGRTAEFADGFTQPVGLAFGPGQTLFVADLATDRIVRVDAQGNTTDFAEVDAPVHLAVEPHVPLEGEPFTVVVTAAEGVVRFDSSGEQVGSSPLTGAAGIATVPGTGEGGTPGPTAPTTAPTPSTTVPDATIDTPVEVTPSAPATTRPPRTTTTISEAEGAPSSTSGGILVASLVIIALIVVGGVAFVAMQRPKRGNKSGFEERSLDTNTVALAFGACAAEEVELAEAEGGVASLEIQSEAAEKRLVVATERLQEARDHSAAVGREARARPASSLAAPAPEPRAAPEPPPLRLEDLELTTAAGRTALDAFLRRDIEGDELEEMWQALGEDRAIEAVRSARAAQAEPAADAVPAVEPADADADAEPDPETLAAAALAEAEGDLEFARAEIGRLSDREDAAQERIVIARRSLEVCQDAHRAELDAEAATAAEARKATAASDTTASEAAAPAPPGTGSDSGVVDLDGGGPRADAGRPVGPVRPPLTADAATVASLRRPPAAPAPAPAPDPISVAPEAVVDASSNNDAPSGDDGATPTEALARPRVRRAGMARGLFGGGRDDAGNVRSSPATFPSTPADAAPGPVTDPVPDPPLAVDDAATVAPIPAPPAPELEPSTVQEPEPSTVQEPEPEPEPEPDPDPDPDPPSLSDLLLHPPSASSSEASELSAARIDEVDLAWGERGLPKFPQVADETGPASAGAGGPDDEPPRPDLKFL